MTPLLKGFDTHQFNGEHRAGPPIKRPDPQNALELYIFKLSDYIHFNCIADTQVSKQFFDPFNPYDRECYYVVFYIADGANAFSISVHSTAAAESDRSETHDRHEVIFAGEPDEVYSIAMAITRLVNEAGGSAKATPLPAKAN